MSDAPVPLRYEGDGQFATPPNWAKRADKVYVVGQIYTMSAIEERSAASHRFYFAQVADGWANLPPHLAEQFPTAEHLRAYALIKAGYCDTSSLVASSRAEALRLAAFIRPMDPFSVVTVEGVVVKRFVAQSQSYRAMDKKTFRESADKVLDIIGELIGADKSELGRAA